MICNFGFGQYSIDINGDFSPQYSNPQAISLAENELSDTLDIGFGFDFFGSTYTEFYISSNGFITFNSSSATGPVAQFIPDTAAPNNLIAAVWGELDPDDILISYETVGLSPLRSLRINFEIYLFGSSASCADGYWLESQIILYETTNIIEIHTTNWNESLCEIYATQGIENAGGTVCYALAGRNNSWWSAYEDYIAFIPDSYIDIAVVSYEPVVCEGQQDIRILIQNLSGRTVDTTYFDWEWDGVPQDSVFINTPIAPDASLQVTLGQKTITAVTSYPLEAWSFNPENGPDADMSNDSISGTVKAGLSGVLTIGGASPDYATITNAVADLMTYGVCDSVIFNIRNGTYTENLDINHYVSTGAGIVVFQSESGNAADVTITQVYNAAGNNRLIDIENNSHMRFRDLTCRVTGSACSNVFYFSSFCSDIQITDCIIIGSVCTGTSSAGASIAMVTGTKDQFRIANNTIRKGSHGIYTLVGSPSLNQGLILSGNDIDSCYRYGIYLNRASSVQIFNNNIFCPQSSAIGIEGTVISGEIVVYRNFISMPVGLYGARFSNYNSSGGNDSLRVFNNMIHLAGNVNNARSLWIEGSNGVYLWHNTINSSNTISTGTGLWVSSSNTITVINNIVTNLGIGKAATITGSVSDYNVFYSVVAPIISGASNYNTLEDWQIASGQDAHSYQMNPEYVSATDLHIGNLSINGTGFILTPPLLTDIDDQSRNSAHSDIGSDEIGFLNDDLGCTALLFPDELIEGANDIEVVVSNLGLNTVNTYTIEWELNDVAQTAITNPGSLGPAQKDTILLGNINMVPGQAYSIQSNTTMPNGNVDMDLENDTILVGPLYPRMNGTYTVGGSTPDFANLTTAINAITQGGVVDSVSLSVREGLYQEPLEFTSSVSYTCSKPVHIYSESGDASDVVIHNNNLVKPVVRLNNASGITFSNITFELTASAFHNVVIIENGASCNLFEGCIFTGRISTQTSAAYATVLCNSNQGADNDFYNNYFYNGSLGLSTNGPNLTTGSLVDIAGNICIENYTGGISVANSRYVNIVNNHASITSAQYSGYTGIYANNCISMEMSHNVVYNPFEGSAALAFLECDGSTQDTTRVFNNYVYAKTSSSLGSVFSGGYSNYTHIANNTVRAIDGNGAGFSWSSNFRIENNVFEVLSNHAALELLNMVGTNIISSDNCFHAPNGDVGELANVRYHTLQQWQALGYDATSFVTDPLFAGTTHHVHHVLLDEQAIPVHFIDTDLDFDIRHASTPDIGADEFTPESLDGGLLAILHPVMPFQSGENELYVRFYNNGSDTLTSLQFNWSVNDTLQTPFLWTGLLAKTEIYDSISIGSFDFIPYTSYDIRIWINQPNGMPDGYTTNDTLEIENQIPGMSGIYTIGGETPDFETITLAVAALHAGGASDDVTFNIRNGVYAEPIALQDFPGSDCDRNVVFQSEGGESAYVTITNLGINAHTLVLNGADGVEFRNLTIVSVNTSFRHAVQYSNGSHCNTFTDNVLIGFQSTSTSNASAVVRSLAGQDTANVFVGNIIRYGSYGFHLTGSAGLWSGVTITDNEYQEVYYRGIYAFRQNGISITYNTMLLSGHSSLLAMEIYDSHEMQDISYNHIIIPVGNYGILVDNCDQTATTRARIYNNFIAIGGTGIARPVYITGSSFVDVIHNSLNAFSTNATLANTTPIYVTSNPSLRIINNAARNTGLGYAIYSNSNTSFIANNNAYHTAGTTFAYWNGGAVETTFTQWQTASGQDANSLNINPAYMSNTDLHTFLTLLNNVGQAGTGIEDDFDSEGRDSIPDIGADEFDPLPLDDAGIFMYGGPHVPFAQGLKNVDLVLKNFGGNTLNSVLVRWTVNGIEQTPYEWMGTLPSTQCDTFIVGTFTFEELTSYQISAWTEMPNDSTDAEPDNDLLATDPFYASLSGVYTVGGFAPDFNLVSDLETILNAGGIINHVTFNFRPGTYSEAIYIDDFPRSSYSHSVTFASESGDSSDVILTQNTNGVALLDFDDAHRIIIRQLSLYNTKGHAVHIRNGASLIAIENCHLEGSATLSSSRSLIYSPSTNEDSISILNNVMLHGYYGIHLYGASFEKRHIITGNTFIGNFHYATYLRAFDGMTLSNNVFDADYTGHRDIYMYNGTNACFIEQNRIFSDGSQPAIYMGAINNTAVNTSRFTNNYIYKSGTSNYDVVFMEDLVKINIDFNSIYNAVGHTGSSALYTDNVTTANIRDNILYSISGPAYDNDGALPTVFNYNAIYSPGPVDAVHNNINYTTLAAFAAATSTNANSKALDPLYISPFTVFPSQYQLSGSGLTISGLTVDIDGTTRTTPPDIGAKEFTPVTHDVRMSHIIAPVDGCGLTADESVVVVLVNHGSTNATGFDVHYEFEGQTITENIGGQIVVAGDSLYFSFTQTIDASGFDTYSMTSWHTYGADLNHSNDTTSHSFINYPPFEDPVENMIPTNGTTGLENQVSLSWAPVEGAVHYDLYLWASTASKPVTPTHTNLTIINKLVTGLAYGTLYRWQIHAVNICDEEMESDTLTFTTRILPDLHITSITIPATAFSEQVIGVEWIVHNQGLGQTVPGTWFDNIYLSVDPTYNSFDPLLGSISNLTSLPAGQSYTHAANVTLPQGTNGLYYIIIKTDHYSAVKETADNNNTSYSATQINVTLSPPPDLIVTEITTPAITFSGQLANITHEVRNTGDGITTDNIWKDEVWLIPAAGNNNGITKLLSTRTHVGLLQPDSVYTSAGQQVIPENIYGLHHIRVHTDVKNDVFEFASEGNNQTISDPFEIVLTPPVDIKPDSLITPDTMSLYQTYWLPYQAHNDGGSAPLIGWTDRYYVSQSPVYNTNFLTHLGYAYHAAGLDPGEYYDKTIPVWLNGNYSGTYYIYIVSDYNNKINEFAFEGNNIIRSAPFEIIRPDLRPDSMIHVANVMSGTTLSLRTEIVNDGPGHAFGNINNRYYLSSDQTLNTMTDVLLTSSTMSNLFIGNADTASQNRSLSMPANMFGPHYLLAHIDAGGVVHETTEADNVKASPITIFESPHPDVVVSSLSAPDTATAGIPFILSYTLTNQGDQRMAQAATDSIFLSFSPTWNRSSAVPLTTRTTATLDTALSIAYTASIEININQNPNIYYIYIISDAKSGVYEGSGESNNILRSDAMIVLAYPEVDLSIQNINGVPDTLTSGQQLTVTYTINNHAAIETYYPAWTERYYFSVDSIFNSNIDMLIGSFTYDGGRIAASDGNPGDGLLEIPDGISGDYYLFIETDAEDINNDPSRNNNANTVRVSGDAHRIHVKLALYPDLQFSLFSCPVDITSGQYFNIIKTVTNAGPGPAGYRTDKLFVSTDNIISIGDLTLDASSQQALASGLSQTDTLSAFVPANYSGNYYILCSIDHGNLIYEHNAENNNVLVASIIATPPPPADLIARNVLVQDSVLAGDSTTISWETKNQGANPATGVFREIVYLSYDSTWQVTDEVIGVLDSGMALSPGDATTRTVTLPVYNVTNGDYHTLIRTDARNNIAESNELNNDGYSFDRTNVDIEELFLDVLTERLLPFHTNRYFKVLVPAEEANRNMFISLKGDSLLGANELYVKYGSVPTEADHDFAYSSPFSPDQQIIARAVVPGYYYIMVKGFMIQGEGPQTISLLARFIRMEITSMSPNRGGNAGFTTIEAIGSELDSIVQVKLVLDDSTLYHEIVADTFIALDDGARILARFNLIGQPLGHYHLLCHRESIWMASYQRGFEIIEGGGPDLQVYWDINPKSYNPRFNSLFQIKIDVENRGDSDAVDRFVRVNTPDYDNPAYYSLNDYYNGIVHPQLVLASEDLNGFPGILRPGGRRTFYVFGSVGGTQGFSIYYDK